MMHAACQYEIVRYMCEYEITSRNKSRSVQNLAFYRVANSLYLTDLTDHSAWQVDKEVCKELTISQIHVRYRDRTAR